VGTWALVSVGGDFGLAPFGSAPKGFLILTANRRFSSFFARTDIPKYLSNNRTQGTAAECKATIEGSLAYFGTYSVSGTDLNLHIEGSTFPNWIGTDQKRTNIVVTEGEFKYTQPAPSGGGPPAVVVLKRV
jgi:Lipocalin-like domain